MTPAGKPQPLPYVQGLRALAALSIAFLHLADEAVRNGNDPRHLVAAVRAFLPWGAGVDIFFVISGFIIVHASEPLFGGGWGAAGRFARRRLARIVPLYWICTLLFLAIAVLNRGAIHGAIGGPGYVAGSLLFVPVARPDGAMLPALSNGWTLDYEMFFYAVMALFLLLPRARAVAGVAAVMVLLVAAGRMGWFGNAQLRYWANPIILEFCGGMALAQLARTGLVLPVPARAGLCVLALIILHVWAGAVAFRAVAFGLPAAMLMAAAALAPAGRPVSRFTLGMVLLGDASYAMYLVHPFVMRGFSILWHRIHLYPALSGPIYVLACLAVAQLFALAVNRGFERKLNALLHGRSGVVNEVVQMSGVRADRLL